MTQVHDKLTRTNVELSNVRNAPKKSTAASFLCFSVRFTQFLIMPMHFFQLPSTFFNGMNRITHKVQKRLRGKLSRKIHLLVMELV